MLGFSVGKSVEKRSQIFSLEKFFGVKAGRAMVLVALQAIAGLVIVSKVWLSVPIVRVRLTMLIVALAC